MVVIEVGMGNYGKVYFFDLFMVEVCKVMFVGRWFYEIKKGFKCKIKKVGMMNF